MDLHFTIAADHHTVDGTETLAFRPDRAISEMVSDSLPSKYEDAAASAVVRGEVAAV